MAPRRHVPDDLPRLPPLDGDVDDLAPADDDAPVLPEEPDALDDAPADDVLTDDEMELPENAPRDVDDPGDDGNPSGEGAELDDDPFSDDGARWTDPDPAGDDEDDGDIDLGAGSTLGDRGEEGPEHDATDEIDELPPLDDDPVGEGPDESIDGAQGVTESASAFGLPTAPAATVRRLGGDGLMLAAGLGAGRLLVAGDALWSVALDAFSDPQVALAPLDSPDDELFTAVSEDASGALYLGTALGAVYRRERQGPWQRLRRPGEGGAAGAVDVLLPDGRVMWARTREGVLLRGEDGVWRDVTGVPGRVHGLAADAVGGMVLASSTQGGAALWGTPDGGRTWSTTPLPDADPPWLLARVGDLCVAASGSGAGSGAVSVDGGRIWERWALLDTATAVSLTETDDGVSLVLFAVYEEAEDRSVVISAGIDGRGRPLDPRRLALVERTEGGPGRADGEDEEGTCRVEALVPLDRAGRRIAVVAARHVLLIERGG